MSVSESGSRKTESARKERLSAKERLWSIIKQIRRVKFVEWEE